MPWLYVAMKDAAWRRYASGRCLATVNPKMSEWGNPIEKTSIILRVCAERAPRELKHLSTWRKRDQTRPHTNFGIVFLLRRRYLYEFYSLHVFQRRHINERKHDCNDTKVSVGVNIPLVAASETGKAQTGAVLLLCNSLRRTLTSFCRTVCMARVLLRGCRATTPVFNKEEVTKYVCSRIRWKAEPQRVMAPYPKTNRLLCHCS